MMVHKPQGVRWWLLHPLPCTSCQHALHLNANSFPLIWARICKQACPSRRVRIHTTWFFCVPSGWRLNSAFQIYSWLSWRTTHGCSLTVDLKTAASGTAVKCALSMTGSSSITRTSISCSFPHHLFDLCEKIPQSECVPSNKPLKIASILYFFKLTATINQLVISFKLRSVIDRFDHN